MNDIPIDTHVMHKWLCKDKPCDRKKEILFMERAISNLVLKQAESKNSMAETMYNHVGYLIGDANSYLECFKRTHCLTDPAQLSELLQKSQRCYWGIDNAESGRRALLWTELGDLLYSLWKLDHWALCDLVKYYDEHIVTSGKAKENDATPMY